MKFLLANAPALALAAAGAAWPSVYGFTAAFMRSPLERAIETSICGGPSHATLMLAHCPPCWIGAAAFFTAALALTYARLRKQPARF